MDPTAYANTNPFVSPSTNQTLQSELSQPKPAYALEQASATDPAAAYVSSSGLSNIVPLSQTAPGAGAGSAQYSTGRTTTSSSNTYGQGYSGLGETDVRASAHNTAASARETAQDVSDSARSTAQDARDRAQVTAQNAANTAQDVSNNAAATAQDAVNNARTTASDLSNKASNTAQDLSNRASNTAQDLSNKASNTAHDAATGIRQRVRKLSVELDKASEHPAVQNAKSAANRNIVQLREQLGRSKTIRELEARTNVDRVWLVVGGVFAYLLLIPLNFLGLALPTTNILTILPAAYLATELLESTNADDERVKALLAYFVILGAIQTSESLAGGVLARRIPQYHTVKLIALAYLLHPKTNGALKVHESVFRPIAQRASTESKSSASSRNGIYTSSNAATTPPTSKSSLSQFNSPAQQPTAQTSGYALADGQSAGQAIGTIPVVIQVPLTAETANLARQQQY